MAGPLLVPLVSLGVKALSTGGQFLQARKFKKQQEEAERKADEALQEARKKISVNYLEGLTLPKEVYELQREALMSSAQRALQAGLEGETRGAAATAGRVQLGQQAGQRQIATQMAQDLFGIQKLAAQEEARLAGLGAGLDLKELEGQQAQAQTAELARQQQIQAGIKGAGEVLKEAGELIPEYMATDAGRATNKLQRQLDRSIRRGEVSPDTTLGEFGELGGRINTSGLTPVSTTQDVTLPSGMRVQMPINLIEGGVSIDYADTPQDVLAAFEKMTSEQRKQYFANR